MPGRISPLVAGIHMCVGNMLSRKEMTVSFQEFAKRIDNIRIKEGAELTYPPNMMLRGLTNLAADL